MNRRVIKAHPLSKDKTIKLVRQDGVYEIIVLKSTLLPYFKRSFRAAFSGKDGFLDIHSENGVIFSYSFRDIQRRYKPVIVHL